MALSTGIPEPRTTKYGLRHTGICNCIGEPKLYTARLHKTSRRDEMVRDETPKPFGPRPKREPRGDVARLETASRRRDRDHLPGSQNAIRSDIGSCKPLKLIAIPVKKIPALRCLNAVNCLPTVVF